MGDQSKSIRVLAVSWGVIAFLIFLARVFQWISHSTFVTCFVGGFVVFALLSTFLLHRLSVVQKKESGSKESDQN